MDKEELIRFSNLSASVSRRYKNWKKLQHYDSNSTTTPTVDRKVNRPVQTLIKGGLTSPEPITIEACWLTVQRTTTTTIIWYTHTTGSDIDTWAEQLIRQLTRMTSCDTQARTTCSLINYFGWVHRVIIWYVSTPHTVQLYQLKQQLKACSVCCTPDVLANRRNIHHCTELLWRFRDSDARYKTAYLLTYLQVEPFWRFAPERLVNYNWLSVWHE